MAKLDLNDEDEKSLVDGIFWNAMDSLSEDDKKLPQVRFTTILFGNLLNPNNRGGRLSLLKSSAHI